MMPLLLRMGLRAILPTHLDWIAAVAVDIVDTVEDSIAAGQGGWTEAESRELRSRIVDIADKLERGILSVAENPPPARPRWKARTHPPRVAS